MPIPIIISEEVYTATYFLAFRGSYVVHIICELYLQMLNLKL